MGRDDFSFAFVNGFSFHFNGGNGTVESGNLFHNGSGHKLGTSSNGLCQNDKIMIKTKVSKEKI